jgi:cyclopropane fatty-acyl-phospholipid synthase-like methyltransferase
VYDVFAPFYDAVQGDRAQHAAYVRSLIEKHHPGARTVLELACGTGSVLKQLDSHYEVSGVDLSKKMLEIAARKVPRVRLIRADMTRIALDERFDVVLCVYDSINHLMRFEQWEAVFERARAHLEDGGLFIFDVNTERRLASFVPQPAVTQWFGDGNLMVLDVVDGGKGHFVWSIRVFEHLGGGSYRLHTEDIVEIAFSADRIRRSLQKRFRRVWTSDEERSRPSPSSGRLHFVCRK